MLSLFYIFLINMFILPLAKWSRIFRFPYTSYCVFCSKATWELKWLFYSRLEIRVHFPEVWSTEFRRNFHFRTSMYMFVYMLCTVKDRTSTTFSTLNQFSTKFCEAYVHFLGVKNMGGHSNF